MENYKFDVRALFGVLRRQIRLIILTMIAIMAVSAVVIFSLAPAYTASALLLVDPSKKNLLEPELQMGNGMSDSARIDSEVEIMRSDSILRNVITSQNLMADPEFGVSMSLRVRLMALLRLAEPIQPSEDQAMNQSLGKLRSAVTVQRRGNTYLIALQVRSQSAATAATIANALAQAYIDEQVSSKVNATLASRAILLARINEARTAITNSENSFDDFVRTNIDTISRDTGRTDITAMQNQLEEMARLRADSSRLADQVQASINVSDLQSITQSLQSDALTELDAQRAALADSISGAAPDAPAVADLRAQLAQIEQRLLREATTEVAQLRNQVTQTQVQEDSLKQQLRSSVLNSSLSAGTLTELYELQQNAELARGQYQTLLSRSQDLEAQASLQIADSRIVSPALPPGGPSFPNTPQLFLVALIGAAGLGIGLAFVYENILGGFVSQSQLESVLRTRVASTVPRVKQKAGEEGSLADQMVSAPLSIFSESVRRIRAAVDLELRQNQKIQLDNTAKPASIVMVTSTAPDEGKTTIALSLARSYALSGRRTLLIDCDLRKPSVHKQLGLEPSTGLLDFLSNNSESREINAILSKDATTGATMILGARRSGLPTDQLISSAAFTRLITAAQRTFDIIIIDTPPVGAVVDALYVAPTADAILHIVRWSATLQSDVRDAMNVLESATQPDTPILAVLNQADEARGEYKNKYGSYYLEYA